MTLGKINGKLRRRLAAGDIPGTIGQIEELAQTAARRLHDATRAVRLTLTDQPSLWAAHIHSGS
jgi:alpha-D-ribose 1-methylphosphonate 5-triphosphate synthase subunit PhnH